MGQYNKYNGSCGGFYWGQNYLAGRPNTHYQLLFEDGLELDDTAGDIFNALRNFAEGMQLHDSYSTLGTFLRSLSDAIGLTDAIGQVGTFFKVFAEGIALTDTIGKLRSFVRSFSDSIGLTDIYKAILVLSIHLIESIRLTDIYSRTISLIISLVEGIQLHDTIAKVKALFRSYIDTIQSADVIQRVMQLKVYLDSISIVDIYTKLTNKVVSSAIVIIDTWSKLQVLFRSFVDTFSIHDTIQKIKELILQLEELLMIRDVGSIKSILIVAWQESMKLADSIVKSVITVVSDTIDVIEVLITKRTFGRVFQEIITVTDTIFNRISLLIMSSIITLSEGEFFRRLNGQLVIWAKQVKKAGVWLQSSINRQSYTKTGANRQAWNTKGKHTGVYTSQSKANNIWNKFNKKQ